MLRRIGPGAILAVALSVPACDPAPADESGVAEEPTFTAWDSAGIEIVENHAPEHAPGQFWTIDTVPEIVLGGANEPGTEANAPTGLVWSVVGLARLADGRVAVLSSEQKQILLFEPTGELTRTIGREGRGPGEFIYPERLQYFPPDTLEVWDYGMTSTIRFDSGGAVLGERSVDYARLRDHGVSSEHTWLPLPDGSLVVAAASQRVFFGEEARLPRAPTLPEYIRIDNTYAAHRLGPASLVAAGGDPLSIHVARGGEIHQLALDGTLLRIIRRTADTVGIAIRARRAEMELRSRQREAMGMPPIPEEDRDEPSGRRTFSRIAALVVDAEGYLWVREWTASEAAVPDQWSIFSPQGRWLGVLAVPTDLAARDLHLCHWLSGTEMDPIGGHRLPPRSRLPCWVGRDFFLTVRVDELGVERVEGYRIRRNGAREES